VMVGKQLKCWNYLSNDTVARLNSSATLLSDPQISYISFVLQPIPYTVTIRFENILISHKPNFISDYEHPVVYETETNL
jgi:hypothetical protein